MSLVITGIIILGALIAGSWTAVQRVRAQPPDGVLDASGRIEGEEVIVNSKIGGRVLRLLVDEGDRVTRGQLMAVLSSDDLAARMRQADAQVEAAQAQVARAQGEVEVLDRQLAQAQAALAFTQAEVTARQRQAQAGLNAALARLAQARTVLNVTRTQAPTAVAEARAMLRGAEADLARVRAAREEARRNLIRLQALQDSGAVAAADADEARTRLEMVDAQVNAASEQVERARAQVDRAQTTPLDVQIREEDVRAAKAQVEATRSQVALARAGTLEVTANREQVRAVARQAEVARAGQQTAWAQTKAAAAARDELRTALAEARVYAPAAGVVVSRVATPGEVVQAGTPLLVIVDLQRLWLKVFIPEPEIGKLRFGAVARVSVDAFPGRAFAARVTDISQRAEFTPKDVQTKEERVKQVFAVKLTVDNSDGLLKPGMPADGQILWKESAAP
jgi:HlyD family secretion protein